jgi:3'-5' exoribonuclease
MGPRLPGDHGPQARPDKPRSLTHNPFAALAAKVEAPAAEPAAAPSVEAALPEAAPPEAPPPSPAPAPAEAAAPPPDAGGETPT